MANYMETTSEGTSWRRAKQVAIFNPLDPTSSKDILFFEEDVATIGDKTFYTDSGIIKTTYNPDSEIVLLDPATGQATGKTIQQKVVYQALFSMYLAEALARDTTIITTTAPVNPTGLT